MRLLYKIKVYLRAVKFFLVVDPYHTKLKRLYGFVKSFPFPNTVLDFRNGRSVRGVRFSDVSNDMFAQMVGNVVRGDNRSYIIDCLFKSYQSISGLRAGSFFPSLNDSTKLNCYPHWCVVLPWDDVKIEEVYKDYPKNLVKNRSNHSLSFNGCTNNDEIISKALSYDAAVSQVDQTINLHNIIKSNAYYQSRRLPVVTILYESDDKWCWMMGGEGNHRAYLFNELEHENFPCEINQIVYLSEVEKWPNVRSGLFSKDEAISFFKQVTDGQNPVASII